MFIARSRSKTFNILDFYLISGTLETELFLWPGVHMFATQEKCYDEDLEKRGINPSVVDISPEGDEMPQQSMVDH